MMTFHRSFAALSLTSVVTATLMLCAGCGTATVETGARPDSSGPDATGPDANGADANGLDAGGLDAGGLDAGGLDAGGLDAGGLDASGSDAGAPPVPPATPAGLTATASASGIALSWQSSAGAIGYIVYRADSASGPFARASSASLASTSFTDVDVVAGATYYYAVSAFNAAGESPWSAPVSATAVEPLAVNSFSLIDASQTGVISGVPVAGFDPLTGGATIDPAAVGSRLSIRANTTPATVGSVRFSFDGNASYRTENTPPYLLCSDDSAGTITACNLAPGAHTLTATPYSAASAVGTAGASLTIAFNISCASESDDAFCARLSKNCEAVSGTDNCGAPRSVASCGDCRSPQTCGGGGTPNVCGTQVAGGWAATCAAEPLPTRDVVYVCDCVNKGLPGGADANCVAGSSANSGTAKDAPKKTWEDVKALWRELPAGGTVALCKGGAITSTGSGWIEWHNVNCASRPCTLRDYDPTGVWTPVIAAAPKVLGPNGPVALGGGGSYVHRGYRFLNVDFISTTKGGPGQQANAFTMLDHHDQIEVCNCTLKGWATGIVTSEDSGVAGVCPQTWIRGNRIGDNCYFAMYWTGANSEVVDNEFDNNGHALCMPWSYGTFTMTNGVTDTGWFQTPYDPRIANHGETHTLYTYGNNDKCPMANVVFKNNVITHSSMYQGDFTTRFDQGGNRVSGLWLDMPHPHGSSWGLSGWLNGVTVENNLVDMRADDGSYHPTMGSDGLVGGDRNYAPPSGERALRGLVVRRNRFYGTGNIIGQSSVIDGLYEDNILYVGAAVGSYAIAIPHGAGSTYPSSATVRNNTVYVSASTNFAAIRTGEGNVGSGYNVTGNVVVFAQGGTGQGACFKVAPAKTSFMDNNVCVGAPNYAQGPDGTPYSLAMWRAHVSGLNLGRLFDMNSATPPLAGMFVDAPSDLTPAPGDTALANKGSTIQTCTVGGVANQSCSSPVAIGSPTWSASEVAKLRDPIPDVGALER